MFKEKRNKKSGLISTSGGVGTALVEVARRLTSQPLLFGFGVLLLLVVVSGLTYKTLSVLVMPALAIFVIGVVVWLVVELRNRGTDGGSSPSAGTVKVEIGKVGKTGNVTGIEGLPLSKNAPSVKLKGRDWQGKVTGLHYQSETMDREREEKGNLEADRPRKEGQEPLREEQAHLEAERSEREEKGRLPTSGAAYHDTGGTQ